jgi:hypothetical protein
MKKLIRDLTVLDNLIIGRVEPNIYAFTTNTIPNYLKVGDTYRPVSTRLKEWEKHFPQLKKQFEGIAKVANEVYFRDFSVHQYLTSDLQKTRLRKENIGDSIYFSDEFFKDINAGDVVAAIADININFKRKTNKYLFYNVEIGLPAKFHYAPTGLWKLRPNQRQTVDAFKIAVESGRTNLLMYAVMRFGKSFTSMSCAAEMGNCSLVVIVSAKADVMDEWKKTVESADNFSDFTFLCSDDLLRDNNAIKNIFKNKKNPKKVVVFLTLHMIC